MICQDDIHILVYLYDAAAHEKKERARALFESEASAGRALMSTQVLQEFYVAVTRKLAVPLEAEVAEKVVRNLSFLPIVQVNAGRILAAIVRSRTQRLFFWDALIIEAALAGGVLIVCLAKICSMVRCSTACTSKIHSYSNPTTY